MSSVDFICMICKSLDFEGKGIILKANVRNITNDREEAIQFFRNCYTLYHSRGMKHYSNYRPLNEEKMVNFKIPPKWPIRDKRNFFEHVFFFFNHLGIFYTYDSFGDWININPTQFFRNFHKYRGILRSIAYDIFCRVCVYGKDETSYDVNIANLLSEFPLLKFLAYERYLSRRKDYIQFKKFSEMDDIVSFANLCLYYGCENSFSSLSKNSGISFTKFNLSFYIIFQLRYEIGNIITMHTYLKNSNH